MHNLLFFLWMILFPLTWDLSDYVQYRLIRKTKQIPNKDTTDVVLFFGVLIIVAVLLYEGK